MQKRSLGDSGPKVSAIGLGCMSMSMAYGEPDPEEAEATLLRALELGIDFFDTANAYGSGHNEELIGRVLAPHRKRFVLATKFGIVRDKGKRGLDGRPEIVADRCEESLQRLQTDVIDLYYLHRVDPKVPVEESVGAMARLIETGKVRALGLSEVNSATLRRAQAIHPISAVQSEYSLWTRDPEDGLLDTCRELGVALVAFSPLGRGMLTGQLNSPDQLEDRDMRRRFPRFQAQYFEANRALVRQLEALSQEKGCTPGQLALAWILAQGPHLLAIPGTKRVARVEENAAAGDLTLSPAERSVLDKLFAREAVAGPRYPESLMTSIQREG